MTIPTIKARIRTGKGEALCASELSEIIGAIGPLLGSVTLLCMYTILGGGYRCPAVSHLEKDSAKSGQIHRFRPRSNRWAYNHHAVAGGEKCRLKSTEQVVDRGPRMEEGHDGITSEPDKKQKTVRVVTHRIVGCQTTRNLGLLFHCIRSIPRTTLSVPPLVFPVQGSYMARCFVKHR